MGILKKELKNNFTIVNNAILRDMNLDIKSRGLLITMLSLPSEWEFSINGLNQILPDGRTTITSGLKKLEELGYLIRTTIRDDKGKILDVDYTLYDEPQKFTKCNNNKVNSENTTEGNINNSVKNNNTNIKQIEGKDTDFNTNYTHYNNTKNLNVADNISIEDYISEKERCPLKRADLLVSHPYPDFPDMDNPDMGFPDMENRIQLNTKQLNTKQLSIKQSIYQPNYNNINNTRDGLIDRERQPKYTMQDYIRLNQIIKQNIGYSDLIISYSNDREIIDEIVELMTEVVTVDNISYMISGVEYPSTIVQQRFWKLKYDHIEYVIVALKENPTRIQNIKAYLIAMLFNSYTTSHNYWQAEVNADMYGRK